MELAEESGSRTHTELITALTGFEVRPAHRDRFSSARIMAASGSAGKLPDEFSQVVGFKATAIQPKSVFRDPSDDRNGQRSQRCRAAFQARSADRDGERRQQIDGQRARSDLALACLDIDRPVWEKRPNRPGGGFGRGAPQGGTQGLVVFGLK